MYTKLLSFLIFACQIILNSSAVFNAPRYAGRTQMPNRPAILPEGYTTFLEDHAAYKIYEIGSTWYEARNRCRAEGARLAITDSYEKVAHINSLKSQAAKDQAKWLHVGIYELNDVWVRIDDNRPIRSVPWIEDNPDGAGQCAGISMSSEGLVDYFCNWPNEWFVCEIPISAN